MLSLRSAVLNLPLLALPLLGSCATSPAPAAHSLVAATISHDVFFTFSEPNDADIDGLIAACEALRVIPGVLYLTAGPRDETRVGPVNQTAFHVALHVEFKDQEAYDGYSPHPVHQALVKEYVPKTSAIVAYDALING